MSTDSTTPAAPDRLTAILIAQRANLAWAMIALGVVSAGVGLFCASKLVAGSAVVKKDDAAADKDAEPLAPPTPYRTERLIGAVGGLLGAVAGVGVGLSILAAARRSAPATAATPQKATTAMTASPRVARVQTLTASQCGASGMPRKSGTYRNSQG